jgi:hypothetical protein
VAVEFAGRLRDLTNATCPAAPRAFAAGDDGLSLMTLRAGGGTSCDMTVKPTSRGRFHFGPTTRQGRWAVWLALVGFVVFLVGTPVIGLLAAAPIPSPLFEVLIGVNVVVLGFGSIGAFVAAGVLALFAILRRHERGVSVFLAVVPLLLLLAFVVLEFAFPHD